MRIEWIRLEDGFLYRMNIKVDEYLFVDEEIFMDENSFIDERF